MINKTLIATLDFNRNDKRDVKRCLNQSRNNMTKIIIRLKDGNFLKSKVNDRIYRRHFKLNECQCLLNKETGSAVDGSGALIAGKFELEKYFDVIGLTDNTNNVNELIAWHENELIRLKRLIN